MPDQVDAAIARTTPRREQGTIRLSSGRQVGMDLPDDLTDGDWCELVATLLTQVRPRARAARGPAARLLVPRGTRVGVGG